MTLRLSQLDVRSMKAEYGGQSDQDAISAWWSTLLKRAGGPIRRMIYSVNVSGVFRTPLNPSTARFTQITHRPNHPSFPPNLPILSANVAQMRSIELPSSSSAISQTIRDELNRLRDDPAR